MFLIDNENKQKVDHQTTQEQQSRENTKTKHYINCLEPTSNTKYNFT